MCDLPFFAQNNGFSWYKCGVERSVSDGFCQEEPRCPSICAAAVVAKRPAVPTPVDGRGSQTPKALTTLPGSTASRSPVAFMRQAGSGP